MLKKLPGLLRFNNPDLLSFKFGRDVHPALSLGWKLYFIYCYILRPRKVLRVLARFYIGNKKELARQLFDKLKGSKKEIDDCILQMDLMETQNNLPVNIKVIGCTLEEMAENCKVITKEAFKIFAL